MLLVDGAALGRLACVQTDRLTEWLDERPWAPGGAVEVVRAPEGVAGQRCIDALRRLALAIDEGMTGLRVLEVRAVRPERILADIAAEFGVASPERATPSTLVKNLEWAPHLLLCGTETRCDAAAVGTTIELTRTLVREHRVPVTSLVFAAEETRQGANLDRVALPSSMLPEDPAEDWRWYQRQRIVWESGGNLQTALKLADWLELSTWPDDQRLERAFESFAPRVLAELSGPIRSVVDAAIAGRATGRASLPPSLQGADGDCAPWVIRAHPAEAPRRWRSLVCRPVSTALIDACARLEGAVRERSLPTEDPEEEATRVAAGYLEANGRDARHHDPIPHLRPTLRWDYATFGHWIQKTPLDRRRSETLHALRALRNHLAHGHHAGWFAVSEFRRIQKDLR